ncbi:hypothetical protein D3C84_486620 [compost metagenome]
MALSGTASGLARPVVPEVNISRKGSEALRMTGSKLTGWRSSSLQKSSPTVSTGGAPSTSISLGRLARSVTTSFEPAPCTRCSMALGPKAVNSGW